MIINPATKNFTEFKKFVNEDLKDFKDLKDRKNVVYGKGVYVRSHKNIKNTLKENIFKSLSEKLISIEKIANNNKRNFMPIKDIKKYVSSFTYEYKSKHNDSIIEFQKLLSSNQLKINY